MNFNSVFEELDKLYKGCTKENEFLEEAYSYPNLLTDIEAKDLIMNSLSNNPDLAKCFNEGNLATTVYVRAKTYSGYSSIGNIVDFELLPNGRIIIKLVETLRAFTRERSYDLEELIKQVHRTTGNSYKLLKALRDTATALDKQRAPKRNIKAERDADALALLTSNPAIADELKSHIIKIKFRVPLVDEHWEDFLIDKAGEDLTEKAIDKLNKLQGDFFALTFAAEAQKAGLVENRPASEDININIEKSWRLVGKLVLDCPISSLSLEAQSIIDATKVKTVGTVSADVNKKEIDCYRLVVALIKHFDNDVLFFEKQDETLVAGLTHTDETHTEVLKEATGEEVEITDEEPAEDPVEPITRQVIIECSKCGAITIKDEADVVFDEDSDLVNVEDECQYCEEKEGYKIVGVVAPYEVTEEIPEEELAEEELAEEEPAEDEVVEENLEEILDIKPSISLSLDGGQGNDVDVL